MDNHLKSWAAGFLDGEGSFTIEKRKNNHRSKNGPEFYYAPKLAVHLRDDDEQSVRALQKAFGVNGYCYKRTPRKPSTFGSWSKPTIECIWRTHEHLPNVLSVISAHPMQGKKSRDFAIWAGAVVSYLNKKIPSKTRQDILGNARVELQNIRKYKEVNL
jgi:hypothetical protein